MQPLLLGHLSDILFMIYKQKIIMSPKYLRYIWGMSRLPRPTHIAHRSNYFQVMTILSREIVSHETDQNSFNLKKKNCR